MHFRRLVCCLPELRSGWERAAAIMMAAAHGLLTPAEPQICHGRNHASIATPCAHRAARCNAGGPVRCNAFPSCDRPLMCGAVRLQVPAAAQAGVVRPVRGSPKAARCVLRPPRAAPCPSPANFGPDAPRRGPGRARGYGVHRHRLHLRAHDVARPTAPLAPSSHRRGGRAAPRHPPRPEPLRPAPPARVEVAAVRHPPRPGQRPTPPRLSACSPSPVTLPPAPRAADEVEKQARAPDNASRKSSAAARRESTGTRSRGAYRCDERSP